MAYSIKVLLNTNGNVTITFPSLTNSYYLVIKHRNGLETWSSIPVNAAMGGYDFSTNDTKAYGNNMILVGSGIWALYTGDVTYEGNIDLLDLGILEDAISNFLFGYQSTDLNGDGNVDLLDTSLLEANVNNFIYMMQP